MGEGQDKPESLKWLAGLALGMSGLVFLYFGYLGLTTKATEGDSLAYHIPISEMVSKGDLFRIEAYKKPFYFYPGMGETFLSGMKGLGIAENLFNVFGWVLLIAVVYSLGRRVKLARRAAIMAAVGVGFWPSVIRLLNNQTVDIWIAVWWTASVWIWEKEKKGLADWLWLGVMMGMVAGTKVSGLLYVGVLLLVYLGKLQKAGRKEIASLIFGLLGIGSWWYVKNWILIGNPLYPAGVLGFMGDANFRLMDWSPLKTLGSYPGGIKLFMESLVSEYLIWGGLLLLPIWVRNRWVALGWLNFLIYLGLPSWPLNMVSDLRYLFVVFIPLTIGLWKKAAENNFLLELSVITILAGFGEMTQLDFRPKLLVIGLLITAICYYYLRRRGWKSI